MLSEACLPCVGADTALVAMAAGKSARGCGRTPDSLPLLPGSLPGRDGGSTKPGTGAAVASVQAGPSTRAGPGTRPGQDSKQTSTAGHPQQMAGTASPDPT